MLSLLEEHRNKPRHLSALSEDLTQEAKNDFELVIYEISASLT